jgi:hypothetical protein
MSGSDVASEANAVKPVYALSTCLKPEQGLDATLE